MANGCGRAWTPEEDNILIESRKRGEAPRLIALRLDRTAKAVSARYAYIRRAAGYSCPVNDNDLRAASKLREAILDLFVRTANERGCDMDKAREYHLGPEPMQRPAGLQPSHKTASISKLNSVLQIQEAA